MAGAATLTNRYRITRIETVDVAAGPTGGPAATKVMVTGTPVLSPEAAAAAVAGMPGTIAQPYQWQFDDAAAASQFFNVDEIVEVTFSKPAAAA